MEYNASEIANKLGIGKTTVVDRIKKLNIPVDHKKKNTLYYSEIHLESIQNFRVKQKYDNLLFRPIYITTTYEYFHSKMNLE